MTISVQVLPEQAPIKNAENHPEGCSESCYNKLKPQTHKTVVNFMGSLRPKKTAVNIIGCVQREDVLTMQKVYWLF